MSILLYIFVNDTLAEWLRRRPAKPMGSPCVGSNPTGVDSAVELQNESFVKLHRARATWSRQFLCAKIHAKSKTAKQQWKKKDLNARWRKEWDGGPTGPARRLNEVRMEAIHMPDFWLRADLPSPRAQNAFQHKQIHRLTEIIEYDVEDSEAIEHKLRWECMPARSHCVAVTPKAEDKWQGHRPTRSTY